MIAIKWFTNEGHKRFNKVQGNYRIKIANTVYNLKCIITHSGRVVTGGHYYADLFMSDGQMVSCMTEIFVISIQHQGSLNHPK